MANDAYELQGLNGFDKVVDGQTFVGRSRGFLAIEEADMSAEGPSPKGTGTVISLAAAPAGLYVGGIIEQLSVTTGQVLVYPMSKDYTIS